NGTFRLESTAVTEDSELSARIASYELAFRMQMSATECTDLSREPESIRKLYGLDHPTTQHFGKNCLLARRLVENAFAQLSLPAASPLATNRLPPPSLPSSLSPAFASGLCDFEDVP
ncbi:MAG: DUF1501 domain-containing protein, partial [Blastochloris sp.]|nr:DUF1501 domain-containing protein [Blastochloris sp.]